MLPPATDRSTQLASPLFFPVRHHSPTAARLVRALILAQRPDVVLIEGPADFNEHLHQLYLPHQLPIAIYSYVQVGAARRGAFYPFCEYSPEWQALLAAREVGATTRFIDLPWHALATEEVPTHRYADDELRRGAYIAALCAKLGVESFDDVWDVLIELDPTLTLAQYLERATTLCAHIRASDPNPAPSDLRREAFMLEQIWQAQGHILVITGGFHTSALSAAWQHLSNATPEISQSPVQRTGPVSNLQSSSPNPPALTPYTYARLDSLVGYEAGMPNPGFYHQVWLDRLRGEHDSHRKLLARTAQALRAQKQTVSAADLIAVETTAQALAQLRGHAQVWRRDLVDGIVGALLKDEVAYGQQHPFLDAIHAALRGDLRGQLASGTLLPPLVHDIQNQLAQHGLTPTSAGADFDFALDDARGLGQSRIAHRMAGLEIPGFERLGGTDWHARTELAERRERWRVRWSPDFDARCIEAALYGPTLEEAAQARLLERAQQAQPTAAHAAHLLLDAALMGLRTLSAQFYAQLAQHLHHENDFIALAAALTPLLALYRYDDVLGLTGQAEVGALLAEAYTRGLWLLESLGQVNDHTTLLNGVSALVQTLERAGAALGLDPSQLISVFERVSRALTHSPLVRGATLGALWTLHAATTMDLLASARYFAAPNALGDYLTGLFHLAREAAQRQSDLMLAIDALLKGYGDEEFLEALPALRLAFSYFTPREKHHLARNVVGANEAATATSLAVDLDTAARALALEASFLKALEKYGIRQP